MRRMFSKKQLEELIKEKSGEILKVNNVKQLNDEQCNNLKVGDIIAKKTGNQYHLYLVTYKEEKQGLCLSYFDSSVVETQSYDYIDGHWVYNSEDKTELGGSSLPEVSGADNGKILEVLSGAWGIGGKKVNVIDAPSSTTLTDEQLAQFKEGIFINGTLLGYRNPIIIPVDETAPNEYFGYLIGLKTAGGGLEHIDFAQFKIGKHNNVITLSNIIPIAFGTQYGAKLQILGKNFPTYPTDEQIGDLICRKGSLQWYKTITQTGITSGDTIALDSNLGKALIDHLEVEINGYRARYEYTDGNYVIYSSKAEVDSGLKLQINMISYNTTNGELSFNQMTFTPDA